MEYKFKPGDVVKATTTGACYNTYLEWAHRYLLHKYKNNTIPNPEHNYIVKCSGPHSISYNAPIYGIESVDGKQQFIMGENGLTLIKRGNTMTTNETSREEAIAQVKRLEEELNKLKAIINKPEEPILTTVDGKAPLVNAGKTYIVGTENWQLTGIGVIKDAQRSVPNIGTNGNIFSSWELAKEYAKAINTLLLLRRQPKVGIPDGGFYQYVIEPIGNPLSEVQITGYLSPINKATSISPCYLTKSDAALAIKTVGEDNTLHMFKTLHRL